MLSLFEIAIYSDLACFLLTRFVINSHHQYCWHFQPQVLEKNCKKLCHNIARALDTVSKRGNFPGLFIMLEAVRGEGKLNLGDK